MTSGPCLQPIDKHAAFVGFGRACRRLASPFVDFDLPDSFSIASDRPLLFAGNHRSLFDVFATLVMFARFDASSRLLIRADMVDSGSTGLFLRRLGAIPTSSETAAEAEDEAVAELARCRAVSIMPEGRLVPPEQWAATGVGEGRPGLSRIARRSGAAVLPVAFVGTEKVWPRGSAPRLRPGRRPTVRMRVGKPMEFVGDDDQANVDAFMTVLGDLIRHTEQG